MRNKINSISDRWQIEEQTKSEKSHSRDFKKFSESLDQWKKDEQNEINKAMAKSFKQMQG